MFFANPVLRAEAEMMTDGMVSDAMLRDLATMRGLPLLIEATPAPRPAMDRAIEELANAEADLRFAERAFRNACRDLGAANVRVLPASWSGGQPTILSPERVRQAKSQAMRWLNSRRALLRKGERRLVAARAAIAALAS